MSRNLKSQFPRLEMISKMKSPKARQLMLKEFSQDRCFCKAVREIVKNTLKRNITIPEKSKAKLVKHKKLILALAEKRKSKSKTRQLVQQSGTGFFLPLVIPLVASVIGELFNKK